MMRSFTLIILHVFATKARAVDLAANSNSDTQDSMDTLADSLIDKLISKLLGSQLSIPRMATPFLSPLSASVGRVQTVQSDLRSYGISSSPLESFALTAIDANNRGNRDLSVRAQQAQIASGWSSVDPKVQNKLKRVLDQVKAKESLLAGISGRLGFFDPLGFATTVTGGKLLFYREVELKHGRLAMLASLGFLVGEQFHPLFGGDIDVPSYVAFQATPLETFWPAVVAAIAIPEVFSVFTFQDPTKGRGWEMKLDHEPGDLGFDPLGLKPKDPKKLKVMQTKELMNGRLAMIAAAGMVAQEYATGQKLF